MYLTDYDLRQIDRDAVLRLGEEEVQRVAERLLSGCNETENPFAQKASNTWPPPGSDSVDHQPHGAVEHSRVTKSVSNASLTSSAAGVEETAEARSRGALVADALSGSVIPAACRPGRQLGLPGLRQSQNLKVGAVLYQRPGRCAACDEYFVRDQIGQACRSDDEVDLLSADPNALALWRPATLHQFEKVTLACGSCSCDQLPRVVARVRMERRTGGYLLDGSMGRGWWRLT